MIARNQFAELRATARRTKDGRIRVSYRLTLRTESGFRDVRRGDTFLAENAGEMSVARAWPRFWQAVREEAKK